MLFCPSELNLNRYRTNESKKGTIGAHRVYLSLKKQSTHRIFLSNKMHRTCKFLPCYTKKIFFLGIQLRVLERESIK